MKRTKTAKKRSESIRAKLIIAQSKEKTVAQASTILTSSSKTRVISYRLTEEQYAELVARCTNRHGEQLLTPAEYARYTTLHQSVAKPIELSLERYRLAIAAQLTTSVTDMVQALDSFKMLTFEAQINRLNIVCADMAKIQNRIQTLLND